MTAHKRWTDLSPRTRLLITAAAVFEAALKAAALVDIKSRPSEQIRGPKAAWVLAVAAVNGLGVAPIVYFRLGRRQRAERP